MRILFRPRSNRIACGVAIGLAERYGVHVSLVRALYIAAFLASPFTLLVYLLLSLCIPSELHVADTLSYVPLDDVTDPREQFERVSQLLTTRLLGTRSSFLIPHPILAMWLVLLAALLELPHVVSSSFYQAYPMVASLINGLSKSGTTLFFIGVALLLLFDSEARTPIPRLMMPARSRFQCERGSGKMIGGVVSGIARVLEIDPAYLRALFLVLNILTMGLAGVGYLLVWYLHRGRYEMAIPPDYQPLSILSKPSLALRIGISLLCVLLAGIFFSTEFRFYFFSEALCEGLALAMIGMALVWHGIGVLRGHLHLWIVGGASLFFLGTFELSSALAHLQVSMAERMEVSEIILALALVYFGTVSLRAYARTLGFSIAGVLALSALCITTRVIPSEYPMELIRFYGFFYPLIFAGFGLWIAFEK